MCGRGVHQTPVCRVTDLDQLSAAVLVVSESEASSRTPHSLHLKYEDRFEVIAAVFFEAATLAQIDPMNLVEHRFLHAASSERALISLNHVWREADGLELMAIDPQPDGICRST